MGFMKQHANGEKMQNGNFRKFSHKYILSSALNHTDAMFFIGIIQAMFPNMCSW
jgi:hypothetical protein